MKRPFWRRNPKGAWKDWRRRALLERAGVGVELDPAERASLALLGEGACAWPLLLERLPAAPRLWSFGIGRDLGFERAFLERTRGSAHAFDPTPRSVAWVRGQQLPPGLTVHAVGLGDRDGEWPFAAPRDARSVDCASGGADGDLRLPVRSLASLARELGGPPDALKVDVEGGEVRVVDDLVALGAGQVAIEFHHGMYGVTFGDTRRALEAFAAAGYRRAWISRRGLEFLFVRAAAR